MTRLIALFIAIAMLSPALAAADNPGQQINELSGQIDAKKQEAQTVQSQLDALKASLDQAVQEYQTVYGQLAQTDDAIATTQKELNSATEQQLYYQKLLDRISVVAYRDGDVHLIEVLLGTKSFKDFLIRLDYIAKISRREAQILMSAKRLRQLIQERREQLDRQKQEQKELLAAVQARQAEITSNLSQQQTLLDALNSNVAALQEEQTKKEAERQALLAAAAKQGGGAATVLLNITFPIPRPYSHGFSNDWGALRAASPAGHQGTDIFALKGTPLVAVTNGTIGDQFGPQNIGGFRLHLIGDDGVDYYYAHLNNDTPGTDDGQGGAQTAYAPGIAPGVRVAAGQVIGYVGDSGDAEPTPPHLHFGITINGEWVNPYPTLRATDWR